MICNFVSLVDKYFYKVVSNYSVSSYHPSFFFFLGILDYLPICFRRDKTMSMQIGALTPRHKVLTVSR